MESNLKSQLELLEKQLQQGSALNSIFDSLGEFLSNSEYQLILYMIEKKVWAGANPPPPPGFKPDKGSVDFGLFLYWFNNPSQLNLSQFDPWKRVVFDLLLFYLIDNKYLHATQITTINYGFFTSGGELIYSDGSVLSTEQYANYDQGWFVAFLNLLITNLHGLWYNDGKFPTTTPPQINLVGAQPNTVTIAILGDCGAGNAASDAVFTSIKGLKPDYLLHVGDVYYGGTPQESQPTGDKYFAPGEEMENLIKRWPTGYNGKSFTLNSNHEMYSGANGLFYDAYGSPIFSAHQNASCFALKFGGWTLLGLDSAFNGTSLDAFMSGNLGDTSDFQVPWIQGLRLDPNKTIVFTHHNGFADDCSSVADLWGQLNHALKGDPFAWYWGHVHNGIVYDRPISIPSNTAKPVLTTNTYARCLGHAALPYGPASSLNGQPIAYKANNLQPTPSKQLYNGFALLTLTQQNGVMTGIQEAFYDVSNQPQPVYQKTLL